jgi:hypothetical protein
MGERERMAEGDQFTGFFGGQDAGEAGGGKDVAFGDGLRLDEVHRGFLKANLTASDRLATQDGFAGDVNHAGFTTGIDVG